LTIFDQIYQKRGNLDRTGETDVTKKGKREKGTGKKFKVDTARRLKRGWIRGGKGGCKEAIRCIGQDSTGQPLRQSLISFDTF
jgi:hypothetical protein